MSRAAVQKMASGAAVHRPRKGSVFCRVAPTSDPGGPAHSPLASRPLKKSGRSHTKPKLACIEPFASIASSSAISVGPSMAPFAKTMRMFSRGFAMSNKCPCEVTYVSISGDHAAQRTSKATIGRHPAYVIPRPPIFKSPLKHRRLRLTSALRVERAEIAPVYSSCRSSGPLTPRFSSNYSTPSTIRKSRTAPSPSAFSYCVCGAVVDGSRLWHLEADLGRDAGALDRLAEASDCERCTPLGNESEGRFSVRSARDHPREFCWP